MKNKPNVYVIAGPNGAGKTTFAKQFLPLYAKCNNFVNADMIALGLAPFAPEKAAMKAGRIVLEQINELSAKKADFAFETTLSGKSYIKLLKRLKKSGYIIHIFFLWIPSVNLALERIKRRVANGGHNVPAKDVKRRFSRGLSNLRKYYMPLSDNWNIINNSVEPPVFIARSEAGELSVLNAEFYKRLGTKEH